MTVKDIFKVLIGTIFCSVMILLFTEYLNISSASSMMKSMLTTTVESSCDFFAQETYKKASTGSGGVVLNSGNVQPLKDFEGVVAHNGVMFTGGTKEAIYENLYGRTSKFATWYRNERTVGSSIQIKGTWRNLDMLAKGLRIPTVSLTRGEESMGKTYAQSMMTPLNLGIPYLDVDTVERICRYNIVNLFSEGKASNIVVDASRKAGEHEVRLNSAGNLVDTPSYVQYKGFRLYYNSFNIEDIEYRIFDIQDANDRVALEKITNINADGLYGGNLSNLDERKYIGVAEIKYSMDIDYVGVTPAAKAIHLASNGNYVVNGYGGTATGTTNINPGEVNQGSITFKNASHSQPLPVSDSIYYYIVR